MIKSNFKYFLAANSCEGFVSYFDGCVSGENAKTYIIKGGPGTGKSSFMRKFAEKAVLKGEEVILCPCSSDPDSLDGVILKQKQIAILDGTAPHVLEPKYPAIREEILNFGQFWDTKKTEKNKNEIISLTNRNKQAHKKAGALLKSAGYILKTRYLESVENVKTDKIEGYCENLCRKYIKKLNRSSNESICFLSGITPKGVVSFPETVLAAANKTVIIDDINGAVSGIILNSLRKTALLFGHDVITFLNPFLPSTLLDGIFIPDISMAFVREYSYLKFESSAHRVHAKRFLLKETEKSNLEQKILDSAVLNLKKAKVLHDQLESYYIKAMDFKSLETFREQFIKDVLG